MDFDQAFQAHADWKIRLRQFLEGTLKDKIDPTTAEKDNVCPLGKWIHSEGQAELGNLPEFQVLIKEHANFHKLAAGVVRTAETNKDAAKKMIDAGGEFSTQSIKITAALSAVRKKVGK